GCVLRFTPDLKHSEIIADGFRNPYDFDFNPDGELFTFDSDNERCVSLPWYEPTRFYHVLPGGHYGWRAPQLGQFWRLPPYSCDVVAPVAYLDRGSPTGVVCYRHTQFPEKYRGGFFLCDWTFGRIWFVGLKRSGASYMATREVFLQAVGDNGFAPTAAAVHPVTGDLFVSIGGRGTRGAVYRIRYSRGKKPDAETLARLRPKRRSLEWQPELAKELPRRANSDDAADRLRALAALWRHREHFGADELLPIIRANLGHADRYVRKATADLIATLGPAERSALGREQMTPLQQTTYCQGIVAADPTEVLARAGRLPVARSLAQGTELEASLAAVRLVQLALGGLTSEKSKGALWEGYTPRREVGRVAAAKVAARLRAALPTGQVQWDREATRVLAMIEDDDPKAVEVLAGRLDAESDPVEDVHYLAVLARLRGRRPARVTEHVAAALLALDRKLTTRKLNRDTNWPLRVAELHAELARKDAKLNAALLESMEFGRPDHALFTRCPGFDRRRAAEIFLARFMKEEDYPWSPGLVHLLAELPEEKSLPVLRRLWDAGGLEDAILPVLARRPQPADRAKFLEGLGSPRLDMVRLCLGALEKLPPGKDDATVLALVRALRALPDGREEGRLRERLGNYLGRLTGQEKLGADRQAWSAWLAKARPDLAKKLGGADGVDVDGWAKRLAKIDWTAGDAGRGKAVFVKASCAACHSGAQALGPDLRGVAGRFSRDDLFTAILQPSKDVSPRYRATLLALSDGRTHQGIVIYEAVDSLILQTGPDATVRITNAQVVARRVTQTSLMPAGLLDKLSDRDIADLYAYLRSLGGPAKRRRRRRMG
ncbi:MAG TPA: hypothetical protein VFA26_07775, partial [Gemmataceae bacterium]|nr:hypothetical protein [Gemmataceae bacterium]